MSATNREPLGVMQLVGQSIRGFWGNFLPLMLVIFVPLVIVNMLQNVLLADFLLNISLKSTSPDPTSVFTTGYLVYLLASTVFTILMVELAVLVAADVLVDEIQSFGAYLVKALKSFFPALILGVLAYFAIVLGMILLILPGLYLAAMWSITLPAILIEGRGFKGMGRSMELTKDYRWPTLGANFLIWLLVMVLAVPFSGVQKFISVSTFTSVPVGLGVAVFTALVTSIIYGTFAMFLVSLHARLRLLKEGLGQRDVDDVFS